MPSTARREAKVVFGTINSVLLEARIVEADERNWGKTHAQQKNGRKKMTTYKSSDESLVDLKARTDRPVVVGIWLA